MSFASLDGLGQVNKLQDTYAKWDQLPPSAIQDFLDLSKELASGCEPIE
jgi:hypothetical protein